MDDLLAHFAAARPDRGEEPCSCCRATGEHEDRSECDRCDGSGRMHAGDDAAFPWCPGRENDQPAPKRRRHWREPKTAAGPVTINYAHNTERAPKLGETYAQHVEPHGRYLVEREQGDTYDQDPKWETGSVTFSNPLHMPWGGGYSDPSNWKHELSRRFGNRRGRALSSAVASAGHDGIITHAEDGRTQEIVDLRHLQRQGARRTVWFAVGHGIAPTAAELFHGSDREEPFSRFDFHRRSLKSEDEEESPLYKQEGEGATTRWWNSRLGSHFTSEHHVASEIAQRMGGHGNVYHVELDQQNPKHYDSEHDLAEEAVGWARKKGYQGLRNLGFSWDKGGWHHADALQNHPQSQQIAEGFRAHLQSRGHDGITYGNEYEGTKGHLSAIAFHPDQVKITQVHGGYDPCPDEPMQHEAVLHGPDELPPDPGTHPIPEGHVRLWHYTRASNVDSIREHGLQRKYARGDSGTGDLSEPSAGVWASTKRPDDVLDDHTTGSAAVVEYHAHPDEISGNAESPWQAAKKGGGYDQEKLKDWASGYHHVIMHGDVHPRQILAIHEGWHGAARYMKHDDPSLESYQWIHDESNEPWNNHLNPYRRGLQALERERGQRREASQVSDYGMEDRPDEDGDPLHAMGSKDWPSDFYDRIHEYDFSHGEHGSAHLTQLRRARGDPEKRVRIYRSAPAMNPESRNAKKGEINHGDWVTLNKPYAEEDARGVNERSAEKWKGPDDPGRHHIWSTVVPAKHIRSAGNDLMEWGYWGPDQKDLEHMSERCSHRNPFTRRERAPRRRRFEDTNYSGKQHFGARQREGDEKPFGGYTMRYHQEDQGERRPRHVIETHHPQDGKVGELNWYGTTGVIHNLDVEEDHSRKGIATAMWSWGQEMFPKPRHSGDRTPMGREWAKSVGGPGLRKRQGVLPMPGLRNPHTGGDEWFHGTRAFPEELSQHGFTDPMEMDQGAYEQPESEAEGTHWNALLGTHFTADHDIAKEFALGEHSSGANRRGGEDDPWRGEARGVVHARLGLRNPKVYASEHDMDHEAYEHEWKAGNHPSEHVPAIGSDDEDERYEAEDMWNTADQLHRQYKNRKIPRSAMAGSWHADASGMTGLNPHPVRTTWINTHPDKWGIANRFRQRLQAQGHDGITYGNEYERSHHGEQANKSAIAFHPDQIQVTQHHGAYEDHLSPEEAEHQQARMPGYGQAELPFERHGAGRDISRIRLKHEPPIVSGHWERDEQGVPTNWVDTDPAQGHHMLTALAPNNRTVGWMHWDKGVVRKIDVNDSWKRSGLGRRMWEHASTITPGLSHSDNRTDEGQGFAKAVGGPLPERVQDHPEWFHEAARDEDSSRFPMTLYRGEGSHDRPSHYPKGSVETGAWWTSDQAAAHRYAAGEKGSVYQLEAERHEVDPRGLPGYYFIQDPAVRARRSPVADYGERSQHEAAWQPTERIFGPTYGLDRRLFTPGEQLKPGVRQALLGRLQGVLEPLLGENWDVVTRAYLAGSEASRWTSPELVGNGDLDVLIGVAYSYARRARPDLGSMTDAEIDQHLNAALQQRFNAPGWHPPFGPEDTYGLTGYVNHNALDIKVIKPYAAYDLTRGEWAVKPPHLPHWSAEQFPQGPALMQQARALIAEVRAILRLPEPFRTQEAGRIWDYIHEGRRQDFTETGLGWQGTGNVLEKALDQASGKLVEKLKQLKYGPADHAPVALGHGMTTADLEPAHA